MDTSPASWIDHEHKGTKKVTKEAQVLFGHSLFLEYGLVFAQHALQAVCLAVGAIRGKVFGIATLR